ncbi:MAG: 2-hydroxyacyl-CoA dehydratase [Dehalococcoidales bacterium]|nr:2-hydroxyacyl-CoA dehydratase [Dehalococcoidales bacterium]
MIELLKLCGYEETEITAELPRVKRAFDKLGVTAGDIELGKQRLVKYYDMELLGIRKIFRLFMREFVDSMLIKEENSRARLIYGFMAPGIELIGSALKAQSKDVYSVHHFWALMMVAGDIFDKMVPVFEAAEKKFLKAGAVGHCGNVKTILGAFALDLYPKPDLLITSGSLCETAPKTFDLLHEYYGIPVCYYDTCQDRDSREYSNASRRTVEFEAKSLQRLLKRIEEVVGFEITGDMLWEAINAKSRFGIAFSRLRKLITASDPLPLSPTHENLWMILGMTTLDAEGFQYATDAINTLCDELQERIDRGTGVVEKGSPRILAICPAHHIDPRLEHLLTEMGIAMIGTDSFISVPYPDKPRNPETMLAMSLQGSLFTCPAQKIPLLIEGCKKFKVDGVFDRYHVGCRTVAGDAMLIKSAVEKELGIPVLLLEWENYDPRIFNHEQYRKKLEAFKGMMLYRKGISSPAA